MDTYSTTDFRKNLKIAYNDEPWVILEAQHGKPSKGVACVKTRMRNLITGRVREKDFRSGDSVEDAQLTDREMQYLHTDGTQYTFMDNANYEQLQIQAEALEEQIK